MAAPDQKFTLCVPSSTAYLYLIREFINNIGQHAGLEEADIAKLELAIDEACTNVIEHAYGSDTSKELLVRATLNAEAMNVDIIDTGRAFDPNSVQSEELERLVAERRSGGLGVRLIKSLVDELKYHIEPGIQNELRVTKKLRKD